MADIAPWIEMAGLLAGGGGLGAVGAYLGIRKKTQSDLEIAYLSQLATQGERIENLEKRNDAHWDEIRQVVREERAACDKRIGEIEMRFTEEIRQVKAEVAHHSEVILDPPQV